MLMKFLFGAKTLWRFYLAHKLTYSAVYYQSGTTGNVYNHKTARNVYIKFVVE